MNYANLRQRGPFGRLLSTVTSKYRQLLIAVLIVLIALGTVAASASYLQMQNKIRELSVLEPVTVVAVAKELQVGDVIDETVLVPIVLYRQEFESNKSSYVALEQKQELIGRVIKVPLLARSFLRREHLAEPGSLPGLVNLIDPNHALIDIDVPQQGFNVFIRPQDKVDVYEVKDGQAQLIAVQAKVVLVDSEPVGKAPLKVTVDPRLQRHLTVAIPDHLLDRALKAKQSKALIATYHKLNPLLNLQPRTNNKAIYVTQPHSFNQASSEIRNLFQTLVFIKGEDREVLSQ